MIIRAAHPGRRLGPVPGPDHALVRADRTRRGSGRASSRSWPPAGAWAPSTAAGWSAPRCTTTCASGGTGGRSRWPGWPASRSRPNTGAGASAAPLMTALAELMTERGYPLSALYPATMTIYRSLGWEIAGHRHDGGAARAGAVLRSPGRHAKPPPGSARAAARTTRPRCSRSSAAPTTSARDCGPITWDEADHAPLADPARPVRRPGPLRLPGPGRLPRLPLAPRPRRDFRRRVVAASAETTRALWAPGRVQCLGGRRRCARRSARPIRSGGCCASRTRTSPSGRAGCSACSTRPPPSPPAASPRRTSPSRCSITDDLRPANSGLWDLTVRAGGEAFPVPNGPVLCRLRCVARRADAAGAGRPRPGRAVRGHARRDAAPGRPGRTAAARPPTPPWTARSPRPRSCSTPLSSRGSRAVPGAQSGQSADTPPAMRDPLAADR